MTAPPPVTVIGCDDRPLPPAAVAAVRGAVLVAASRPRLTALDLPPGVERVVLGRLDAALDAICAAPGPVAVLASGDPGFFGIVRALRSRGVSPRVIPGVSSVALAFARLGLDWDDALVVSAHGRDTRPARAAALAHPKVAILTGPPADAMRALRADLLAAGRRLFAAERLGTPRERVRELTDGAEQGPVRKVADPHVLISLDPVAVDPAGPGASADGPRWLAGHQGAPPGWALPEEAFEHRDSMITKAEVRALVLARLGPGPGRTVWDVGAGSGSVAIECARFGAFAVAVDADPEQCGRIRRNAARHGVRLSVVPGRAPQVLPDLPEPDAVFVGGGDDTVLAGVLQAARPDRVVVTLAAVDRVRGVCELLADRGYRVDGTQLQAARVTELPTRSMRLAAANPVFVVCGRRLWGEGPQRW